MSMLSRVAENIYWLGRYLERAENTARIVNVNANLLLDLPKHVRLGWTPILEIMSSREIFDEHYEQPDEASVISFLVTDTRNPGSIISSLVAARENARTIREIIPREAWEQINSVYLLAKEQQTQIRNGRYRYEYLNKVIQAQQAITGNLAGTMTHDAGYDFLRLGRNIERADMTTRIIDVRSANLLPYVDNDISPFENIQWMSVLKSLTGYQMYRRQMRLRITRPDVLRFLLLDDKFPRAVKHILQQVEYCLSDLPNSQGVIDELKTVQHQLQNAQPETLKQDMLHEFIDEMQQGLNNLHNKMAESYF
ncbi:MAG: alpha-E domain-containing protein [Thalassotalea sp.]